MDAGLFHLACSISGYSASVIAFACYFTLLNRIGADRAGYVTVLMPIVALTSSTFAEGYRVDASGGCRHHGGHRRQRAGVANAEKRLSATPPPARPPTGCRATR